jgi:hypothetical protein
VPKIIALYKPIEDTGTGGMVTFHVPVQYLCQLFNNTSLVTLAGYVSRAAYEAKKTPLMHSSAQLKERPTGDCEAWPEWFCQQIMANVAEGDAFAGAAPVYAAEPGAEEPQA